MCSIVNLNVNESRNVDCEVSIDSSWHKLGHSSANGIVAAQAHINKKVIDTAVLTKFFMEFKQERRL